MSLAALDFPTRIVPLSIGLGGDAAGGVGDLLGHRLARSVPLEKLASNWRFLTAFALQQFGGMVRV